MAVHGGFTPKNITTDLTAEKTDYVEVVGSNAQFTQPYRTLQEEEIERTKEKEIQMALDKVQNNTSKELTILNRLDRKANDLKEIAVELHHQGSDILEVVSAGGL